MFQFLIKESFPHIFFILFSVMIIWVLQYLKQGYNSIQAVSKRCILLLNNRATMENVSRMEVIAAYGGSISLHASPSKNRGFCTFSRRRNDAFVPERSSSADVRVTVLGIPISTTSGGSPGTTCTRWPPITASIRPTRRPHAYKATTLVNNSARVTLSNE